mmetsp:Transcript_16107/g.23894  ORF Transcript_16107/g.23894 Transcript_16107/m.23894 type:complete len:143 (-) Transcript_16107:46-474(-)|eukprot:CAMPEP_0171459564 /NCGR_PEP_ID=MMETSP0945-20130129/4797_1 /TAXON_ID=109269 /ORGANISM="Vaucheria litorea, Strain CCMP2940" /LENGTH=142 /DNA_ID=CAMNT_0011985607 /DNA_START=42 /DNA_END=470 /DNA_ORIENTATION=-
MAIIKANKVVILLNGRRAGKKAIVVKVHESGTPQRKYMHAFVVGLDKYPSRVNKKMPKKKILKRTKCSPFVKYVNVSQIMPTRYTADLDLKGIIDESKYKKNRMKVKKALQKHLTNRYRNMGEIKTEKKATGTKYFYTKLAY